MSIRVTQTKKGKRYAARVHLGDGKYKLLETRDTRGEAKEDEAKWLLSKRTPGKVQAKTFSKRFLREYGDRNKKSSYDHMKGGIDQWLKKFGNRSLASIGRDESIEWAEENRWAVQRVITMLNAAVEEGVIDKNEMRGQSLRTRGRADNEPLTPEEVERLATIAEEKHGPMMRAFVLFTAYSGMRVGEVFALEWSDVRFDERRVMVNRRLYKGTLDLPKSNRKREIVLLPEARDALLPLDRSTPWVFLAKRGGPMTQSVLTYYWQKISAAFGKEVTPHELRHFLGHHLYRRRRMDADVVGAQLGHANGRLVEDLYGHGSVGALDQLEADYEDNVVRLKAVGE